MQWLPPDQLTYLDNVSFQMAPNLAPLQNYLKKMSLIVVCLCNPPNKHDKDNELWSLSLSLFCPPPSPGAKLPFQLLFGDCPRQMMEMLCVHRLRKGWPGTSVMHVPCARIILVLVLGMCLLCERALFPLYLSFVLISLLFPSIYLLFWFLSMSPLKLQDMCSMVLAGLSLNGMAPSTSPSPQPFWGFSNSLPPRGEQTEEDEHLERRERKEEGWQWQGLGVEGRNVLVLNRLLALLDLF